MDMKPAIRQTTLSWTLVGLLAALCAVLAVMQYRWIDEVADAHRERMKNELNGRLQRVRQEFNETVWAVSMLQARPSREANDHREESEQGYLGRWRRWTAEAARAPIVKRVGLVRPADGRVELRLLDEQAGEFRDAAWPSEWARAKERFETRALRQGPPPNLEDGTALVEFPRFGGLGFGGPGPGPGPRSAEIEWLVVELDEEYLSHQVLPELIRRHMSYEGGREYKALVVSRRAPDRIVYTNDPKEGLTLAGTASASVALFDEIRGPAGGPSGGPSPAGRPPAADGPRPRAGGGPTAQGRWLLYVRDEAGSLEALVERGRWRNYAVSGALLALLMATAWVLIRYTRQAQRLAELQMNFVAGVSHELRTPLAVIGTAGYNLRGKLSANPAQVARYGALIETESQKLSAMVEQILQFAALRAGKGVRRNEPVLLEDVIEQGLQASKEIHAAGCDVEKKIEARLPVVLGDPVALRHAVQNLLSNAAKYGMEGSNWVGVTASSAETEAGAFVEIRVSDRGPGIPLEEQSHIFDPFFRGKYAVQDQIHGTGLGLDLVKRIVEAHGGTIRVESAPMRGAEFVMRIPAAPAEYQDEFSHSAG